MNVVSIHGVDLLATIIRDIHKAEAAGRTVIRIELTENEHYAVSKACAVYAPRCEPRQSAEAGKLAHLYGTPVRIVEDA